MLSNCQKVPELPVITIRSALNEVGVGCPAEPQAQSKRDTAKFWDLYRQQVQL